MLERFDNSTAPDRARRPTADRRTDRATRRAELEAFEHRLDARLRAFCDQVDSESLADAMTSSLEEEIAFFDYGLSLAGTSALKQELVKQKVLRLNQKNNRRIDRRHP